MPTTIQLRCVLSRRLPRPAKQSFRVRLSAGRSPDERSAGSLAIVLDSLPHRSLCFRSGSAARRAVSLWLTGPPANPPLSSLRREERSHHWLSPVSRRFTALQAAEPHSIHSFFRRFESIF